MLLGGFLDFLDANEAEMFALSVECKELFKLGPNLAIIEVDSFSAI